MKQLASHHPSFREKLFFFLSGAIISVPFPALANSLVRNFLIGNSSLYRADIISVALIAPLFEEFAKSYPLYYRHGETERSIMTLGFLSGLGFGVLEFILYVFFLEAPPLARIFLILFHASNTLIIARGIALSRPLVYFIAAFLLHAFYNSLIQEANMMAFIPIALSFTLAIIFYSQGSNYIYDPVCHQDSKLGSSKNRP